MPKALVACKADQMRRQSQGKSVQAQEAKVTASHRAPCRGNLKPCAPASAAQPTLIESECRVLLGIRRAEEHSVLRDVIEKRADGRRGVQVARGGYPDVAKASCRHNDDPN